MLGITELELRCQFELRCQNYGASLLNALNFPPPARQSKGLARAGWTLGLTTLHATHFGYDGNYGASLLNALNSDRLTLCFAAFLQPLRHAIMRTGFHRPVALCTVEPPPLAPPHKGEGVSTVLS